MKGLDPVRIHHVSDARARADAILREARTQAAAILDESAAEAAGLIRQAEHDGQSSADLDTNRGWAAARRRARGIRLAAQRDAYDALRTAVVAAVRTDQRREAMLEDIAGRARDLLGPAAKVIVDGDAVRASRDSIHIRWTLQDAVDQSLSRHGPEIEELWR